MPISRNDVEYLARLARLDLTPHEKQRFEKELGSILTYIDQLNDLQHYCCFHLSRIKNHSHKDAPTIFKDDRFIEIGKNECYYCNGSYFADYVIDDPILEIDDDKIRTENSVTYRNRDKCYEAEDALFFEYLLRHIASKVN